MKIATSPFVYWGVAVFMPEKVGDLQGFSLEVPQFYFGLPNLCDPCAVLEKLRRLMFSLPLHGFALFNHNQETLFLQ